MPTSALTSTLVRILVEADNRQYPVGAGFMVSNRHVVTCAHVIADALGLSRSAETMPAEALSLDFPLLEEAQPIKAIPRIWHPIREGSRVGEVEDIAVLELCPDQSGLGGTSPAPMVALDASALFDRPVRMCGFPAGMETGDWIAGRMQGPITTGWIQLDHQLGQRAVAPGFSGTPVWDKQENAVIGIIVSCQARGDLTSAYMIPVSTLIKAWSKIDGQCRPANPYRGLQAFHAQDAANFFGRDSESEELLEAVRRNPLATVVGPSGSGKSSLVFAGVVAKLEVDQEWLIVRMRPGNDPFAALATPFSALLFSGSDKLERREQRNRMVKKLKAQKLTVADIVALVLQENPGKRLLIIVDQFEELFTQTTHDQYRHLFVDGLIETVKVHRKPLVCTVLLTVRADFLSHFLNFASLAQAIDRFPKKILGPMNTDGLKQAIIGPAKRLGVTLENWLAERILQDLEGQSGALPLLEFTMTLLWEHQSQRLLTHESYEAIGGVEKALAHYADDVCLDRQEDGDELRRIFVQLVRPGEGTEDTRQSATRDQVGTENWPLVTELADDRLVTTGRDEDLHTETVELVHEALIRHWRPLREWIETERSFRVWQNHLRHSLSEWQTFDQDAELLLRGVPLALAQEQLEKNSEKLTATERQFISKSIMRRDREKKRDQEKRDQDQAKRARRRWRITVGSLVVSVIMIGLAGWAMVQREQAVTSMEEAVTSKTQMEQQRDKAWRNQSLFLANLSKQRVKAGNQEQAVLLALEALPKNMSAPDRPYVTEAEAALYRALNAYKTVHETGHMEVYFLWHAAFSPDGSRIVVMSNGGESHLWDVKGGREIAALSNGLYADFSPDGSRIVTASNANVLLWDAVTGEQTGEIAIQRGGVLRVAKFTADGSKILTASSSEDEAVRLWDAATLAEVAVFKGDDVAFMNAAISPDGTRIAALGSVMKPRYQNVIHLWDAGTGREIAAIDGLQGGTSALAYQNPGPVFSPDGTLLIAAKQGNAVGLWDAGDGTLKNVLEGHDGRISQVGFSPHSSRIITASADGTVRVWNRDTQKEEIVMLHSKRASRLPLGGGAAYAGFSPNGRLIVTAGDNGVRLWRAADGAPVADLNTGAFDYSVFSPDGKSIAALSSSKAVLWSVDVGDTTAVFESGPGRVVDMAFSPDGSRILVALSDGTARLLDRKDGAVMAVLSGHGEPLTGVLFHPSGTLMLTASVDGTARLWDAGGNPVARLEGHKAAIVHSEFSPDGTLILTTSKDRTARLWDNKGNNFVVFREHEDAVHHGMFSQDGTYVVTASADQTARLWDTKTAKQLKVFRDPEGWVRFASISPDGRFIVTGDGRINASGVGRRANNESETGYKAHLWDVASGERRAEIGGVYRGMWGTIVQGSFSPDGRRIVTAGGAGARLWNTESGAMIAYLSDCPRVLRAAFNGGGRRIVTVTNQGTVHIWDGAKGIHLASLESFETRNRGACSFNPEPYAEVVALGADGRYVAVVGSDAKVRFMRLYLSTQALITHARKLVPRELTEDEQRWFFLKSK